MNKLLTCAALAALLAGCAQPQKQERPQASVPQAFPLAGADGGTAAADLHWQQFFSDARLRALIAAALEKNRDLRVAVLAIEQARAQVGLRDADRLPTVGVSLSGSRAPNAAGNTTRTVNAGIGTTAWELDLFGRLAGLSEAARAQLLGTVEARRAVQLSLVASVAGAWLNLVADEELIELARQTLASREESLRLVQLRFEHGVAPQQDLRAAESLSQAARAALVQFRRQRALDLDALGFLTGEVLPADLRLELTTGAIALPDLPAGTPSEVLIRRPDVRQAEQGLLAAQANITAARAAFFPRISLTAGVGAASSDLAGLFRAGQWGWTVAPSLLQTLFDSGRNQAGVAAAEAARDIALAQYERAIQSAFREVADALAGRATWGEQQQAQAAVVEAEAARTRLAQLRQQHGLASQLELLDAQRSLFAAQQALVQVRLARLQNQVQLYRVLGGGWSG